MFLINRGEIDGRLDPEVILYKRKLLNFNFPVKQLKQLLKEKPQYGSNQAGIDRCSITEPRYIRITDINEYGLLKDNVGVTAKLVEDKYLLNNNDILFARSGATVGKVYLHKNDLVNYQCFYAGYMIRFIVNENLLLPEFLFCYTQLNVYKEWTKAIQRTAGQPNINAEEYKSLNIPLPNLEKQAEIIAFFESAYASKKQKEAQASELLASIDSYLLQELGITLPPPSEKKTYFITRSSQVSGGRFDPFYHQVEFAGLEQAIIQSKFKKCLLHNALTFLESGSRPSGGVSQYESGVLSFGGEHINDKCEIEIRTPKYIPTEYHQNHLLTKTKLHDILLVKDGATTGKIGIITDENYTGQNINEHVFMMRFNESADSFFILNLLATSLYQKLIGKAITGTTVTGLTKGVVRNLKIPLPPLKKQTEIANHISAIRNQAKQLQQQATTELEQAKRHVEQMILGE